MKKNLLFLVCGLIFGLLSPVLQAQEIDRDISFGFKFGVGSSNFTNDDDDIYNAGMQFGGGYWMIIPVGKNFSIRPELLITTRGAIEQNAEFVEMLIEIDTTQVPWDSTITETSFFEDIPFDLTYIDVPVLVQYTFGDVGSGVQPYVFAGPRIGIAISTSTHFSSVYEKDILFELDSHAFEMGVIAGAGVNVGMFSINARYQQGVTRVLYNRDLRDTGFAVELGLRIL